MSKSTISSENQYPLREGWVGLTAGLVNSERRKILSLLRLEIGRLVGKLGVGGSISQSVGWLLGWLVAWVVGWLVG